MKEKKKQISGIQILALFLCLVMLPWAASCKKSEEKKKVADFGTYGADIALNLAKEYPYRSPYSDGEAGAGEMIKKELQKIGYEVKTQPFTSQSGKVSNNYIVRIEGEGFMQRDSFGEYSKVRKTVVIGAHYDAPVPYEQRYNYPDYDGIQNNACGIGALLTVAKQMYGHKYGYDVIIVAFGAGTNSYMGASKFLEEMSDEEKKKIECMYCIESVYAGDKLYAHAGLSSLKDGNKYSFRRKLYEAYDVAYENSVYSQTGVDLNYNMSLLSFDVDNDGKTDIYREVTRVKSDYVPFDKESIPIVFFESSDYNFSKLEDMKETKNLALQTNSGAIRGTTLDSSKALSEALDEERLKVRINVTAFIIEKAVAKGSQNCVTVSQYEAGETLAPTGQANRKLTTTPSASSEASET
ncbi:MAG: M28 family peptidase [Clostridiales bacterium]|nr:M28 family peptidase [Clostridiales bacterium]